MDKFNCLLSLAIKGDTQAEYFVGFDYNFGLCIQKNKKKAIYWLKKAANKGHIDSIIDLYKIYSEDQEIKKDINHALHWRKKYYKQDHNIPFYILFP
jgi:TPR repeat protein